MWKLILSNIKYYKTAITIAYILCLLELILLSMGINEKESGMLYAPLGMTVWLFFLARFGHYMVYRDNVERFHAILPVGKKEIAAARILLGIIIWLIFFVTYVILTEIFISDALKQFNYWSLVVMNGAVLCANVLPLIWHDFIFISHGKHNKLVAYLFYIPINVVLILIIYFVSSRMFSPLENVQKISHELFFTPIGSFTLFFLGLVITYISYKLYIRRVSYLHSEFGIKSNIKVKTGDVT